MLQAPKQKKPLIDCGIFICLYAQCISESIKRKVPIVEAWRFMHFEQSDMNTFRRAFVLALHRAALIPLHFGFDL